MRGRIKGWPSAAPLALLLALIAIPAAAQQPPAVARATAESMAECRSAGGTPTLRPEYETQADLNGDGVADHLIDLAGLNCEGAASYFCGSAGCPLVVFLSGPAGHRAEPIGHVQAWSLERGGALPVLVLNLHGGACGRVGSAACQRRLAWNGRALAAAGAARPPAVAAPAPTAPAAPDIKSPVAGRAAPPPSPGGAAWAVRAGSDGRPMAMVIGPGVVQGLAVACHQGVPVMVLTLRARPPSGPVTLSLAGSRGQAALPLRQLGRGETWIADLRGSAAPALLAGADAALDLAINGGRQGRLSLQGSTRAVQQALGGCAAF